MTRWKTGHESVLASGAPVAPSYVGQTSIPDYDALRDAAITRVRGGKSFAGQAEDPFFLDVGVPASRETYGNGVRKVIYHDPEWWPTR